MKLTSCGDEPFAVLDISECYQLQKARVRRGFRFLNDGTQLLIQDEVVCETGLEYHWFWHTHADIEISEDGLHATLSQHKKQLRFQLLADPASSFMSMETEPLSNSPSPEQSANEGIRKLVVYGKGIANHTIGVLVTPMIEDSAPSHQLQPMASWS